MQQTFPAGSAQHITISHVADDLQIQGWDQQTVEITTNREIEQLQSEGSTLIISICDDSIALKVPYETTIAVTDVHGEVTIEQVRQVEVNNVTDIKIKHIQNTVQLGTIHGDVDLDEIQGTITLGTIHGDLTVSGATHIAVNQIGSSCTLSNIRQDIQLGYIGSDVDISNVGGNVQVNSIGSDANLRNIAGSVNIGSIGSDLHLQGHFAAGTVSHVRVGGDATLLLPSEPNLTIHASVGGDISGRSIVSNRVGNYATLVYGNGSAQLELSVGGDLQLRGDKSPKSSSSNGESWWNDFACEMADFTNEMSHLGRDLSSEITQAVNAATASINFDMEHNTGFSDKQRNAFKKSFNAAKKQQRKAEEKLSRLHVRMNNREWHMNPERIDHLVEQAQRAAKEGVSGALEAVEQALKNLSLSSSFVPQPPMPPTSPTSPTSPATQQANDERAQPEVPVAPAAYTGPNIHTEESTTIEQEREAILRMIAEGRITPEEGDMLLEAL
jgi:hypothetical protein